MRITDDVLVDAQPFGLSAQLFRLVVSRRQEQQHQQQQGVAAAAWGGVNDAWLEEEEGGEGEGEGERAAKWACALGHMINDPGEGRKPNVAFKVNWILGGRHVWRTHTRNPRQTPTITQQPQYQQQNRTHPTPHLTNAFFSTHRPTNQQAARLCLRDAGARALLPWIPTLPASAARDREGERVVVAVVARGDMAAKSDDDDTELFVAYGQDPRSVGMV